MFDRRGSVSLAIAIVAGLLATAGTGVWGLSQRAQAREAETALAAAQVHAEELSAELGECQARVTAESVTAAATGTTDALGVALSPQLADVQARADLVRSLPRLEVTRALIAVASPRLLAAEARMLGCEAQRATGTDSAALGCGREVVTVWSAAVEAQAGCPRVVEPGE